MWGFGGSRAANSEGGKIEEIRHSIQQRRLRVVVMSKSPVAPLDQSTVDKALLPSVTKLLLLKQNVKAYRGWKLISPYLRYRLLRKSHPKKAMTGQQKGQLNADAEDVGSGGAVVGGAHAFVLFVSRAVGLAPVSFERLVSVRAAGAASGARPRPTRWALSKSRACCALSVAALVIMVCCSVFGLYRELRTPPNISIRLRSMTARVVGSGDVMAVLMTSIVGVGGAPSRMVRLLRVLELLSQADNSLGIKLVHTQERKICMIIFAVLLAWTCLLIDDFTLYAKRAKVAGSLTSLLQNYLAFYLLYYVVIFLEVQFAFMAHSIFLRLKRLNDVLKSTGRNLSHLQEEAKTKNAGDIFIKIRPSEIGPRKVGNLVDALGLVADSNKVTSQEPAECIRRLSELHGILCAAAREVDASYGLPVLIILISTLLHLIVTPYFLILELGGAHRVHYLILQFLWCSAHALRLFILVEPCHRTKNEAAKTGDIVGEMLGHGQASPAVIRRLELFSRQLLHRTPDFTALGVCSLDRPLIASVTAAVTTYLVILIQFQKQDDIDSEKPK